MKKNGISFCLVLIGLILIFTIQSCQVFQKKQPEKTPKPSEAQNQKVSDRFSLMVGSKSISINDEKFELNAPVIELEGHSYLPLRFFLDYFQAEQINYDPDTEEISFKLTRNSPLGKDKLKDYLPSEDAQNSNTASSENENYESYKSMYIQSMTESYKGTATFDFDQDQKAFVLKPENELLGLIMLAIDGNQAKIESWKEFVNTLIVLSNTIKTNMPDHSILVINPSDSSILFLHVKNGEVLWDVLNN
jgi:hypothetical protein